MKHTLLASAIVVLAQGLFPCAAVADLRAPAKPLATRAQQADKVFVGVLVNRKLRDGDWCHADLKVKLAMKGVEAGDLVPVLWRPKVARYDAVEGQEGLALLKYVHEGRYWLRSDTFEDAKLADEARKALAGNPYIGHWALTLPNSAAGWLGVEEADGKLEASILWGGGSVKPVTSVKVEGEQLVVTREQVARGGPDKGKKITETITAKRSGDDLKLVTVKAKPDGKEFARGEFTGKLQATLPPRPDLSKVKYGEPVELLNGKALTGWVPLNPKAKMGWSVKDGVLQNRTEHGKGFANIRTEKEFEDFNLKVETRTLKDSNSGIYLRGIYEIQIFESFGKPVDSHHMGALYSRITPSVRAEKPIGEWQTLDITLVDRHITVVLNGKTIIDNQPALGCTGGALWSDPTKPGPIYLQGNHSDIDFRNMVLRPVLK